MSKKGFGPFRDGGLGGLTGADIGVMGEVDVARAKRNHSVSLIRFDHRHVVLIFREFLADP